MKKALCIILALLTAIPLVSCAGESGKTNATSTGTGPVRTVEDDGLPELDFGGETVVLITDSIIGINGNNRAADMYRETLTNDVLNDAIYNRKAAVEERLGIKLKVHIENTAGRHSLAVCNDSILTGLDEYQILAGIAAHTYSAIHSGYYLNLLDEKNAGYLDLEREWWNQYLIENSTVYGNCSAITGALSLSYVKYSYATFFDKAFATEHNIKNDDLYQLVRDGKWTKDKQLEIIKGLYSDVTGDGKTDDDMYGLLIENSGALDTYWSAYDLSLLKRTVDGGLEFNNSHDKITDAVNDIYSLVYENGDVFTFDAIALAPQNIDVENYIAEAFASNQALFAVLKLTACDRKSLREMKDGYGLLPMPKWDEYQEDYYTYVFDQFEVYTIPKTVRNVDAATATLEALAIESYKYVAPAYYNKVLNGRYMSDPDSSEMLDRITTNVKLPTEWLLSYALDKMPQYAIRYLIAEEHSNLFSSFWRSSKKKYIKVLDTVLDDYKKLET